MQNIIKNKILVWNGYYLPAKKYGGPLTSLVTMVETCSDENTFYIISANHDLGETTPFDGITEGWQDVGDAKVYYTDTKKYDWNYKKMRTLVEEVYPDMVWITGIISPAKKWPLAKVCRDLKIPYVISPRGEVNEGAFHISYTKKLLMSKFTVLFGLYKNAFYHVTWDEEIFGLKKYFNVDEERIFNCPNIAVSQNINDRSIEKQCNSIKLVYISRIHRKKNLLMAIEAVELLNGDVTFDIYGPQEDEEYWNDCQKEIEKAPENVHINYCGALQPNEVLQKYTEYHAFLFPTHSENYGHAIAESLSAQCPVFIIKGATPWDDIDEIAGYVSKEKTAISLAKNIKKILLMNQNEYNCLLSTTAKYSEERKKKDNAVKLHKEMINKIVKSKQ